ncbi:MAG: lytic transglycosylase domain-containing protein [Chitinophagales bacterium]
MSSRTSLLVLLLCTLGVGTFLSTHLSKSPPIPPSQKKTQKLYLIDKAEIFISDISSFETKIRSISQKLQIAPEWLMAVIHTESKFDRCASNNAGSEAIGLLQWMPRTIGEYGISAKDLEESTHLEQLDYVYQYFNKMKRLAGGYNSLTDLYLAVLYPKALKRSKNKSYALYSYPSREYELNEGLDLNQDGKVTINDIEKKLRKRYPEAFINVDDTQKRAAEESALVSKDLQINSFGS